MSVENDMAVLSKIRESVRQQRPESSFANDIFEAADDWHNLGSLLIENNPKTDFQGRARQERELLQALYGFVSRRSLEDQRRCVPLFEAAERLIKIAEARLPSKDGYLGIFRIVRQEFGFLQSEHGFKVVDEKPWSIRFSSGKIYVEVGDSTYLETACEFGPEPGSSRHFWLSDLLFLYGDQRHLDFRDNAKFPETEIAVESWLISAATIFKQFGGEVIANAPGIFDRLQDAQNRRDREIGEEMDRLYGPKP